MAQVKKHFMKEGSVVLEAFLDLDVFEKVKGEFLNGEFVDEVHPILHAFKMTKVSGDGALFVKEFLKKVLGDVNFSWDVRSFGWKDYTIINDDVTLDDGYDVYFCLEDWEYSNGARIVYVDGNGGYVYFTPKANTLVLVKRSKNMQKFIEYVNHYAKEKRQYYLVGESK